MFCIGIDMSKKDFHAAFDDGLVRPFPNDADGFGMFVSTMETNGGVSGETSVGVESTGVYHLPLCRYLSSRGWKAFVLNPIVVSRFAKARIRVVKTDKQDAVVVREALLSGAGHPFSEPEGSAALKGLVMERDGLVKIRVQLKGRLEAVRFPEDGRTRKKHGFDRILRAVREEIERVEGDMERVESEDQRLLRSIPGVGVASAAALVAHVGPIERFPGPKQLAAYLGLDCRVRESGTSVRGKGCLTKRGNRRLRSLLFNAAFISKKYVPELQDYYLRKKSEGHHHFSALCATERKLVNIIWAVWTRRTPFERRPSQHATLST